MRSIIRFPASVAAIVYLALLANGPPVEAAPPGRMPNTMMFRSSINSMPMSGAMRGGVFASTSPSTMNTFMPVLPTTNSLAGRGMAFTPGSYQSAPGGYGSGSRMYGASNSMPSYSSAGYGSSGYSTRGGPGTIQDMTTASIQSTMPTAVNFLNAMGVPNQGGQISWPLELRVMGPSEVGELRTQIEGLLQIASTQAARGQVSPNVVLAARRAVNRMDVLLLQDKERGGLGMSSFEDSERFLRQLKDGLKLLQ